MERNEHLTSAVELLQQLIATPSVSRDEAMAADVFCRFIGKYGINFRRICNNILIEGAYDKRKPTLLLNAHIDTVKPVSSWTREPFVATIEGDRLYGLGSNDCGGGLVTLLQVFLTLSSKEQPYNIIYLASAEEEVSGANGFSRALPELPPIDLAIVGEPTGMQPAIAEKGLMVLDIKSHGKSGHAARGEGVNAIYEALDDLMWLRNLKFEKVSPLLGPTLLNVTVINAGTQHNVIPDECTMTVDVRTNEYYTNEEIYEYVCKHLKSEVTARSFRLHSSSVSSENPIVRKCIEMGMQPFGSPTLSDQALMPFPSLKLGPGQSSRSHSADEYICISEMEHALTTYIRLLDGSTIC